MLPTGIPEKFLRPQDIFESNPSHNIFFRISYINKKNSSGERPHAATFFFRMRICLSPSPPERGVTSYVKKKNSSGERPEKTSEPSTPAASPGKESSSYSKLL